MVITMQNTMSNVRRVLACAAAGFFASVAVAQGTASHRVRVVLVSKQSSLHTSLSNRDVYLLHVTPQRGAAFDAIALDNYPSYAEALPLQGFNKDVAFSLKLIRTPECDRAPEKDEQGPSIRCFAIERGSLRLPKNAAADLWWK
jgi:hypothetical protein